MSDTLVKCVICGKEFPWDNNRKTCSDDCKYERNLERNRTWAERYRDKYKTNIPKKLCECCGKEFQPRNTRGRFCSDDCRYEQKRRDKAETRTVRKLEKKVCGICGKSFETDYNEKYCSPYCRSEANRIRSRVSKVKEPRKCVICGAEFIPKFSSQEWCDRGCQKTLYKQRERIKSERPVGVKKSVSNVDAIERTARQNGMTYGKYKAQEMIDRHARVELPEWAKGDSR